MPKYFWNQIKQNQKAICYAAEMLHVIKQNEMIVQLGIYYTQNGPEILLYRGIILDIRRTVWNRSNFRHALTLEERQHGETSMQRERFDC